jgi:hypothetical protein
MKNADALKAGAGTSAASPERGLRWQAMLEQPDPGAHIAQVYRDAGFLAEWARCFIEAGLRAGEGAVVLCTLPLWETIRERLEAHGVDVAGAAARSQLYRAGVHSILLEWMSGRCSQTAFDIAAGRAIEQMLQRYPAVRVFSELADVLLAKDDRILALNVQRAWNTLLRGRPVAVLSAWRLESLDPSSYRTRLESLYLAHDRVLPDATSAAAPAVPSSDAPCPPSAI